MLSCCFVVFFLILLCMCGANIQIKECTSSNNWMCSSFTVPLLFLRQPSMILDLLTDQVGFIWLFLNSTTFRTVHIRYISTHKKTSWSFSMHQLRYGWPPPNIYSQVFFFQRGWAFSSQTISEQPFRERVCRQWQIVQVSYFSIYSRMHEKEILAKRKEGCNTVS